MNEHHAGELAYYDTFSGLVPCKVTNVRRDETGRTLVTIKLTATRGAYKRGEEIADLRPDYVVPRSSVRVRSGMASPPPTRPERADRVRRRGRAGRYRIRNNYTWQPMEEER